MNFIPTELPGVILIEPRVFRDERGFFLETYQREKYAAGGIDVDFVQDNHSRSARGTLRGLHAQLRRPQGKLIRVIEGEIFDVAVDVRRGSPDFGKWVGAWLSAENLHQLYIPPGFVHGFCVTSETAQVQYKCTDYYDPSSEITVLWNDPAIGIRWPDSVFLTPPLLSAKDQQGRLLADLLEGLPVFSE
jgi:dTDP-4-dehydrorhamnose 3,5-epimerase